MRKAFIDTKFDATSGNEEFRPALNRCEFLEALVRLAASKYVAPEKGKADLVHAQALQRLMNEHVLRLENQDDWQEFRDDHLWKQEVSDVLEANQIAIRSIFRGYITRRENSGRYPVYQSQGEYRNKIAMEDAINFAITDLNLEISYKEALYRYGMSKITVTKENNNNEEKVICHGRTLFANHDYLFMVFTEFLEYLGRLSVLIYDKNKLYYGYGKQD